MLVPKVLLINPPETRQLGYTNPPLGLLYLAGMLKAHGIESKLVDGGLLGWNSVEEALVDYEPDIVGITCLTPGRQKAFQVARLVKARNPKTLVVMGGAHPTIMYRQILENYPEVDIVVRGEGEHTFLEIVQGLDLDKIAGIVFRSKGEIIENKPREYVANLDDIPSPAWEMIDFQQYPARGSGIINGVDLNVEPRVSVIFSRGCQGHCTFCSTWWIWRQWRYRSPTHMADELELLNKVYQVKHLVFADDSFSLNREAAIELCREIIRRKLKIAFHVTTRVDAVDEEMLHLLKQAGCYEIAYGIETGSPKLLKKMNKETDLTTSERAIRLTKAAGLRVTALIIVGNVGETLETVKETASFLRSTKPTTIGSVGGLWILPGTALYQQAKRLGLINDDFWLGDEPYMIWNYEYSESELAEFQKIIERSASFELQLKAKLGKYITPAWRTRIKRGLQVLKLNFY
jgi:anaerobic magnesium-protoporphyrin IX monomethyl ester cyclase